MRPIKVICTVGPTSLQEAVLRGFAARGVFLVRINLSHVPLEEIERYIQALKGCGIPIAIDTEGSQIRTGMMPGGGAVQFLNNELVRIHGREMRCGAYDLYFTPTDIIQFFRPGDLIALDFNSVLLRVEDISQCRSAGFISCRVIIEGSVGSRKGVHCDLPGRVMPPFSEKDRAAVKLAKKHGIKHFTLSFMDSAQQVQEFKRLYPEAVTYAKIETLSGLRDVDAILQEADGILIDRGDLSREVPIERIPLIQRHLIQRACEAGKEVFVASNLMETMASELKPSRAEANDIVSTILSGVTGFVLTKETAVGKYPVETVNMMNALVRQAAMAGPQPASPMLDAQKLLDRDLNGLLVAPHGGRLVDRFLPPAPGEDFSGLPRVHLDDELLMDLEQLGVGSFSPLEGFLTSEDYRCVLSEMRLKTGVPWTIPIILPVSALDSARLKIGSQVALVSRSDGETYGVLDLEDIYPFEKDAYSREVFATTNDSHPGVEHLKAYGEFLLGGKVRLLRRRLLPHSYVNLTPRQVRSIFESRGWSKIVGFHTRNVIHRSHEFIQLRAMEQYGADGLFVHPIVGKKKTGDYTADTIIAAYELMMEKHYPSNRVVFAGFSTWSRYAGPREAVFTALCRQNFGCSHFIVGRDHTGVGSFYGPDDSKVIFSRFPDIGIVPVFYSEIGYSPALGRHASRSEVGDAHALEDISGTQARQFLLGKTPPPDWFMRPTISNLILERLAEGKEVFVG
ncbi:MAG: sulfate adenylyltransferase [Elusimicrobia bacterium]|nr:sulfate adenylyltransferase [Elusimicrobiota bacterium]